MTESQKRKRAFQKSKKWREFRHRKNVSQKGLDPVTGKKLTKLANLHHLDLDESHYTDIEDDIEDESRFVLVNRKTHETIHFLFTYYKSDPGIIGRLETILEEMKKINGKKEERAE